MSSRRTFLFTGSTPVTTGFEPNWIKLQTISGSFIVWGGPGFSLLPKESFRYLEPGLTHSKALCRSLIVADLKVRWKSHLAPVPDACDEEVLDLMEQAGSGLVILKGIAGDNLEKESLENRLESLREICQRCDYAGLHYVISQYFADHGETAEIVKKKLDFLRELRPALASLRVGVGSAGYPGSPSSS